MDILFEQHLIRVISGVMADDFRSDYQGDNWKLINEFEENLGRLESISEGMESIELEHMYQEIIQDCPMFQDNEQWTSLKSAIEFYNLSIRGEEYRSWDK
ncbi:hypothetical protein [Virgibacillus sp. SK37]|uniref:hypothetical protein n=1 Tax=Virgibacillus sp. SK37 TaxID=403957 RepID=UPI0004D0D29F|nr:hypothetical protein [Virgibacillus sp. SK37]AIF45676.1 hypothetical protein X953_18990 [Virgibacillus sp. SK37]